MVRGSSTLGARALAGPHQGLESSHRGAGWAGIRDCDQGLCGSSPSPASLGNVGILFWLWFSPQLPAESSKTLPLAQSSSSGWAVGKGTEVGAQVGTEPIPAAAWVGDHSIVSVWGITAAPRALLPAVNSWVFGPAAGMGWSYPANWNSLEPCVCPQARAQLLLALQYSARLFGDSK